MDSGFLLSLIVLLGGIWIYLYRLILDLTVTAPADPTLLFLGYMHYIVLSYLALALYLFYRIRRASVEDSSVKKRIEFATGILVETWPFAVIVLVFSFVSAKVVTGGWRAVGFFIVLAGLIPFYRTLRAARSRPQGVRVRAEHLAWFWISIVPCGLAYICLMSFVLSDVKIETDKTFYRQSEPVLVSVRAAGYIFRPRLSKLSFGIYQKELILDETVLVPADKHLDQELIMVDYVPEVFGIKRTAFHVVNLVKGQ
jgi:hypothetical protein